MKILIIFCLLLTFSFPTYSNEYAGELYPKIVKDSYEKMVLEKVIDGDTIHASGRRIRLWGIDAPEKGEELYEISSKVLELFLEDVPLSCKFINTDPYQREVMHCYAGDTDIGGLMVMTGFAKDFPKYSKQFYHSEQVFAKEGLLGVWK